MNKLPNKPKFFNPKNESEEDDENRVFHFEMSSAYAAASSAAAQPKKRRGKFLELKRRMLKDSG